jgi:ATP-binding cassette subfamily B multidrug efflux pump
VAFTLSLVLRLNMLLGRMMTQLNSLMRNLGTVQNSADMVARPIGLPDRHEATSSRSKSAAIRFDRASFAYHVDLPVITDLSLTIAPGEKIGIVGRSGAGKSTFVNLLLRFYDLQTRAGSRSMARTSPGNPGIAAPCDRHGDTGYLAASPLDSREHRVRAS